MSPRTSRIDTVMGVSFIISAVIHLAVFLLLVWWGQLFSPQQALQETYYVDVVNLPTSNPQAGGSVQKPDEAEPAPVQPMAAASPSSAAPKGGTKFVKPMAPQETAETEAAFAERMAKLERNSENRHEEAVLEKLRSKVKSGGSAEAAFELAVRRAIDLASEKFTKPPNHAVYENGFLFKPKGISNETSR